MTSRPALVSLAVVAFLAGCGGGSRHLASGTVQTATRSPASAAPLGAQRLVPVPAGALDSAVQDAAATTFGGGAVLLGGLTAADTSRDDIVTVTRAGSRRVGRLPTALHDSAAVALGRLVYLFGGGTATAQIDTIVRVDPATGAAEAIGHLPSGSSDQSAAGIGGTAYIVGGYTGGTWLNNAVYEYVPAAGRVFRLGRLPAPTTHAAAATLGSIAYVIGGRGASVGTPTDAIVAVDVAKRKIVPAGTLPQPLSDLAAVGETHGILVAGGKSSAGTVASIVELQPRGAVPRIDTVTSSAVPPLLDPNNVYAADAAGRLSPAVRHARPYVYVPNSDSNTVDVIDQRTFKIIRHFAVGALPQHVVPAYDLKTLYVTNDNGNSLTPIDPNTGKPGATIPVDDPYNMYFTPNGRYAIVVAERLHRLDFRDAHTFALHKSLAVPCSGADHLDFSADGSYAIVSCEFSGVMLKVDVQRERVIGTLQLRAGAAPQDVKLSPDGKVFYVADMNTGGVWLIDGVNLRVFRFMPTGAGAHGLYPSRDARYLYVTNRAAGSISVVSFRTRHIVKTWHIPGGGSPDMGNVSADGTVLWLSGRWSSEVYAIDTTTGKLLARIPVGRGPHGLCVWPQPGRYSLGHTGILR